jgi:hypothetical protein
MVALKHPRCRWSCSPQVDLQELLDLPLEAVRGLLAAVAAHVAPPPVTVSKGGLWWL